MKHQKLIALLSATLCAATLSAQSAKPNSMVLVEGGTFQMGSNDESDAQPVHSVTVSSFYMSRLKVTIDEWMDGIGVYPEGYDERWTGKSHVPETDWKTTAVRNITWYDAVLYCNRRSVSEGLTPCYASNNSKDAITYSKQFRVEFPNVTCDWNANGYRLPTEAEWEYAARGGKSKSQYKYVGGNDARKARAAVTADGIEQMGFGDREWCWDWYSSTYYAESGNGDNPRGPYYGEKMYSGGSDVYCRSSRGGENEDAPLGVESWPVYNRSYLNPVMYDTLVGPYPYGFRVVRNAKNADSKKNIIVRRDVEVKITGVPYKYFMTDDYDALRAELAKYGCRAPDIGNLWENPALAQSVRNKMTEIGACWSITVSNGSGILNYYTTDEDPHSAFLKDLLMK